MTLIDVGDFFLNGAHNASGIFASLHLDDAGNRFCDTILNDGTLTNLGAHPDIRHVSDEHRGAIDLFENDIANIIGITNQANTTNEITLFVHGHLTTTRIGVVSGQGVVHFLHGQIVVMQPLWVGEHLILTCIATLCIDFSNTRNTAQHGSDDPILNNPAFGELFNRQGALAISGVLNGVLIDFTQTC